MANGENRILLGPPGVGKTHLAISFATEAITQGYTALFANRRRFGGRMPKGKRKRDSPTFSQSLESTRRTHYR
ncbi:ATP-binding protein [Weizmannia coagulans]|nr:MULTISPECIES: ATP-binding protein [Heyndrickxia]MDL4843593.1 ATP-binding protein [Heyndrickxia coagulans]